MPTNNCGVKATFSKIDEIIIAMTGEIILV
jgi:hypothetical protein